MARIIHVDTYLIDPDNSIEHTGLTVNEWLLHVLMTTTCWTQGTLTEAKDFEWTDDNIFNSQTCTRMDCEQFFEEGITVKSPSFFVQALVHYFNSVLYISHHMINENREKRRLERKNGKKKKK